MKTQDPFASGSPLLDLPLVLRRFADLTLAQVEMPAEIAGGAHRQVCGEAHGELTGEVASLWALRRLLWRVVHTEVREALAGMNLAHRTDRVTVEIELDQHARVLAAHLTYDDGESHRLQLPDLRLSTEPGLELYPRTDPEIAGSLVVDLYEALHGWLQAALGHRLHGLVETALVYAEGLKLLQDADVRDHSNPREAARLRADVRPIATRLGVELFIPAADPAYPVASSYVSTWTGTIAELLVTTEAVLATPTTPVPLDVS